MQFASNTRLCPGCVLHQKHKTDIKAAPKLTKSDLESVRDFMKQMQADGVLHASGDLKVCVVHACVSRITTVPHIGC